jgi:hypothetical protein
VQHLQRIREIGRVFIRPQDHTRRQVRLVANLLGDGDQLLGHGRAALPGWEIARAELLYALEIDIAFLERLVSDTQGRLLQESNLRGIPQAMR